MHASNGTYQLQLLLVRGGGVIMLFGTIAILSPLNFLWTEAPLKRPEMLTTAVLINRRPFVRPWQLFVIAAIPIVLGTVTSYYIIACGCRPLHALIVNWASLSSCNSGRCMVILCMCHVGQKRQVWLVFSLLCPFPCGQMINLGSDAKPCG